MWKVFKKYDFDIIHTHTSKSGFLGRIAGKLSGCRKVIHTVHGIAFHQHEVPLKRVFYILLEMVAGLFNDKMVLVNKFYRSKFWFIPARKIMTIYNSIDYSELQPKKRRSDGIIKFISVGRLDRQKSPMDLLAAMRILCTKRQDINLSIVGDGEYYKRMESYITENDMQDKVQLMGWQNNVPQLLSEHDIFVNSPIYEAFGLVFCEAGYTGLPVISTNVEGIPEVVEQGETGILVPPQDPEALAEAMLYLAENKDVATRMGEKARQIIRKKFDLSVFIKEYTKLYELH